MMALADPSSLLALNVLLEERSVTRAARRLGITQSSMSHRLAQLRVQLADPLFVRGGSALVPTPRALHMAAPLAEALRALEAAVAAPAPFSASVARGTLRLVMPDLLATLAPELTAWFGEHAPGVALRFVMVGVDLPRVLAGPEHSLALVPAHFVAGDMRSRSVGELGFGVAARRKHPLWRRPLSVERWTSFPHVVVSIGNDGANLIEEELGRRAVQRRVGLVVPGFLAGLFSLMRSDLLMNVPTPLADEAVRVLGLRVKAAPLALPRPRFKMAWHPRFQDDALHRWARDVVLERARRAFGRAA